MTTPSRTPPRQLIAGDSIDFLIAIPDAYAGWEGSARLTGPDNFALSAATVATEGTDFHVFFAGPNEPGTQQLGEGQYQLTVWASVGEGATAQRATLAQFPVSIQPDLSKGSPKAPFCVRMLALIERAIECRIKGNNDGGLAAYTIDGVSVTKIPFEELERKRNKYAGEVAQLQNPNGSIGRIPFVFSPAGSPMDLRRRFQ